MPTDAYTAAIHQMILMSRDPLIYLAIDERTSGFDAADIMAIRIAKASALFYSIQLDEALEMALEINKQLTEMHLESCRILNLIMLFRIYAKLSDNPGMKSCVEEAANLLNKESPVELSLMVECARAMLAYRTLGNMQDSLNILVDSIERAENPFCRVNVLHCLAMAYILSSRHDLALDYLGAAYDVAAQHQLSVQMLDISIEMISVCAHLGKYEMAERFNGIAQNMVDQLRLPVFRVGMYFNYGIMKNQQKDYRASVLFYQKSLAELDAHRVHLPQTQFSIYSNLANTLNFLDEGEQALNYQLDAEALIAENGTPEMRADLSSDIALSLVALERWDEAMNRLKEVARFYKKHGKTDKLIHATRALAFYYQQRQDYLRAFATMEKLDQINQEYIGILQESNSKAGEEKLRKIMADTKALRDRYDSLLVEVTKRQAARFTGESKAAKRVIDSAVLASMHREASVLIQGESGSGKEVLAQMIHYSSPQKNHPFISVNCAAISESLFDIEFFGSAPGPLTGIDEERKGFFEQAGEGTLFLDEISEIPQLFQQKLLNALDSKSYTPIGKKRAQTIRCRIISSTTQDLLELFKNGLFRMDLLHRLNTLEITVPPLRERKADIPLLVESFARDFSRETTKRVPQIKDAFYDRLGGYDFPGNVRELKNVIERIFILYYTPVWTADILDNIDIFKRNKHLSGSLLEHNIKELDKERIIEALRKTGGKQKTAAKLLNMTESTLCRKIKRYGIK